MSGSSRKVRLHFFLRKPRAGSNYSVERLFDAVIGALPAGEYEVRRRVCPFESTGIVRRLALIVWASFSQGDINHITGDVNFLGLLMSRSRTVLTILDSASMHRLSGWRRWCFAMVWLRLPIWRAGRVTVISQATQQETTGYVRTDPAKLRLIPCCVPGGMSADRRVFPESHPRFLVVGTKPNKNLPRAVEALSGLPCTLVIIGELSETHRKLLVQHGVEAENHVDLDDATMALQYRAADVVMCISTYEGFGLPILEAQAVGCPLIASRRSPLQEVAGPGSCLVDPENVDEIRAAARRIIEDAAYRATLVQSGFENVRGYSPEAIARQYASVYDELLCGAL